MPRRYASKLGENGENFYCPRGCKLRYGPSEVSKLKEELAKAKENAAKRIKWAEQRAERARKDAEAAERSRAATKGHLTRQRKRAKAGVCPVCTRSFKQVHAHMSRMHPDFDPEADHDHID